ncbi:MAG: thermonuclease family protein [Candidatus Omnitrophota bacterium]|nr:thermonuclease family protein [Candidatus Omnitrophota bacterium]MBU1894274.1 thermonuclease family protein [Candidatus Omnitrophota bacterium]
MRFKKTCFFLVVTVITFLYAAGCVTASSESQIYFVKRIIDGDTIELTNRKLVRYIGIDTPEIRRRSGYGVWRYEPEAYSLDAKKLNSTLVAGKKVQLEFDVQKYDKYDRWLAYVYVGDKMINEELLRQGYAKVLTIPPNTKYRERLKKAEESAKENKQGLWRDRQSIR